MGSEWFGASLAVKGPVVERVEGIVTVDWLFVWGEGGEFDYWEGMCGHDDSKWRHGGGAGFGGAKVSFCGRIRRQISRIFTLIFLGYIVEDRLKAFNKSICIEN